MLLAASLAAAGACGADDEGECSRDGQCAAGSACVSHACVARIGPEAQRWSLEVAPKLETPYAVRELPESRCWARAGPAGGRPRGLDERPHRPPGLRAAPSMPSSVHVVLSVASTIPGRRGLQFEGDGVSTGAGQPYEAKVALPSAVLGRPGQLMVVPLAPLDRWMPPWVLDVTVTESTAVALPGAEDTLTLEGSVDAAPPDRH